MLLQLVILDFKRRPPLFFLVNLTYKFNKTAETTQYKFSKKKELTIMYPKFHKDNFIRSTFVTSQQVPAATKVFSHSGLNFKCVWDIFSAWSSRYGFRKWVGLDRPCPTNYFFLSDLPISFSQLLTTKTLSLNHACLKTKSFHCLSY